ncbi:MAG: hypothetical protein ABSA48_02470 [Terracidiphilus sp.]|jgi:hypothetical protein
METDKKTGTAVASGGKLSSSRVGKKEIPAERKRTEWPDAIIAQQDGKE